MKRMRITRFLSALTAAAHLASAVVSSAQVVLPLQPDKETNLNFVDTPLEIILDQYAVMTGRTVLQAPNTKAQINLSSNGPLSHEDALVAIEAMLAMHNIALVPMGEKFLKVVQIGTARQEGMKTRMDIPEEGYPETDELISQLITLQYVEIEEVKNVVQSLLHGYGKIQTFQRTNSMLVTGTASNIKRILEILALLDQPVENRIETRIYEIKYAEASKIASSLNELIKQSQEEQDQTPDPAVQAEPTIKSPPGVIRAKKAEPKPRIAEIAAQMEQAERGIISGKVKIVADDRTNILFVLSRPENFIFFDRIVAVLDRPVEPEITVRVVNLEYADADEIAAILNSFIGAASAKDEVGGIASGGEAESSGPTARAISEYVRERAARREQLTEDSKSALGQLSSATKILSDKRTNSLLLMGRKGDLAALMEVIAELDTMLAQVLIEAVIVEVTLGDNISYGVDWLQRSMTVYNQENIGGIDIRQPVAGFGGGFATANELTFQDGSGLVSREDIGLPGGALSYYVTLFDLNIDAIIRMAASSSDAKVLATPVILTTDNTDAQIVSGEERPIVTSTTTSSDTTAQTSQYEYKNIGIQLDVTPRINPERFVVMEIKQTADNVGDIVQIDDNDVPVITKREMTASIGVQDRQTIVLGGLVQSGDRKSRTKVPLLGDLPVLGTLFRSDSKQYNKTELLVFITPYVLTTPEEARRETRRLRTSLNIEKEDWPRGWSASTMFDPETAVEPATAETNGVQVYKISTWTNPIQQTSVINVVTEPPEGPVKDAEAPEKTMEPIDPTVSDPLFKNTPDEEDIDIETLHEEAEMIEATEAAAPETEIAPADLPANAPDETNPFGIPAP